MGKYSSLRDTLDRFAQPPDFQQRVDEIKKLYADQTVAEMARSFAVTRKEKQDLETSIKTINCELEALSQLLVSHLEEQQLHKIQLESGETCYIEDSPYCSVENRDLAIAWLKDTGHEAMLTVQWQTYNAFVKELLISGKPVPPGTKVFMKSSARLRGGNNNAEE